MLADDTELFIADTRQFPEARPNVLLIVDTSGSLSEVIDAHTGYDPAVRYMGRCDHARVYWRIGMGAPPQCTTRRWFEHNALVCKTALDAFAQGLGRYVGRLAQYDPAAGAAWKRLDELEKTRWVECEDDGGYHGDGTDRLALYARDGDHRRPWSSEQPDEIAWGQHPADRLYTVHDGNYLNWVHDSSSVAATRLQVLKDVATTLLARINDVNVGVMVTNFDQGGTLVHPLEDVATARASLIDSINGIRAGGWTPLAETLYEAGQYFAGRAVDYGGARYLSASTTDARNTARIDAAYASPLRYGCQKNFVVLLSDGTPTLDTDADAKIAMLPGFASLVGPGCDGTGDGACLDDMAAYLYAADLDPGLAGRQNVITHVVGFTADVALLSSTAARGGGAYFTTGDSASLLAALTDVIFSITDTQTSFTAATVPVNSFNRVRNLDELYLAVFRATDTARWPGNIKKYRLRGADGTIVDARGRPAIDPRSAWFAPDSRSFWSTAADGSDVTLGGAAGKIPEPAVRNVYTYLGEALLTHPDNAVQQSNTRIDEALLGIGDPGDPTRDELIDFIRGSHDTGDIGHTGQRPPPMGDPLHAKPVVVRTAKRRAAPGRRTGSSTRQPTTVCCMPSTRRQASSVGPSLRRNSSKTRRYSMPTLHRPPDTMASMATFVRTCTRTPMVSSSMGKANGFTSSSACAAAAPRTTDWTSQGRTRRAYYGARTLQHCPDWDKVGQPPPRRGLRSKAPARTTACWCWYSAAATTRLRTDSRPAPIKKATQYSSSMPSMANCFGTRAGADQISMRPTWPIRSPPTSGCSILTPTDSPIGCMPPTWAAKSGDSTSSTDNPPPG